MKLRTGREFDWDQDRLNKINTAQLASELTASRYQGMKLRAELDPPRAATGGFPYAARNCAEWNWFDLTEEERQRLSLRCEA